MGWKAKRFGKQIVKSAKNIGQSVAGIFGGGKKGGDGGGDFGPQRYSEARSRAAGAGTVNFTEEGTRE